MKKHFITLAVMCITGITAHAISIGMGGVGVDIPVTKIVKAASQYSVDILLHYDNKTIDVKSILGLMSLAVPSGENVIIEANGDQAEAAINEIAAILS